MDNYFTKSVLVGALIISVVFTNVGLFGRAKAESGVGNEVFKVVVSLFGISNSTKDVLTLVNVKDQRLNCLMLKTPKIKDRIKSVTQ